MSEPNTEYIDAIWREAMTEATGGFDPVTAGKVVKNCLEVLAKQVEAMKVFDWSTVGPREVAAAAVHNAKLVDMIHRLSEFASGNADSRPEVSGALGSLQGLSDEAFRAVYEVIQKDKMQRKQDVPEPSGEDSRA